MLTQNISDCRRRYGVQSVKKSLDETLLLGCENAALPPDRLQVAKVLSRRTVYRDDAKRVFQNFPDQAANSLSTILLDAMRAVLAGITSVGLTVICWAGAALAIYIATFPIRGMSGGGETWENTFIWFVAPGVGSYLAMQFTHRWFSDVPVKVLAIWITCVVTIIGGILLFFSLAIIELEMTSAFGYFVLLGQCISFVVGAWIYYNSY